MARTRIRMAALAVLVTLTTFALPQLMVMLGLAGPLLVLVVVLGALAVLVLRSARLIFSRPRHRHPGGAAALTGKEP